MPRDAFPLFQKHPQALTVDTTSFRVTIGMESSVRNPERRERKNINVFAAGQSGRIKWTASGVQDCVMHLQDQWTAFASRGKSRDWDPYPRILSYMRDKYGHREAIAHYYRMASVVGFLHRHMKGLKQSGIVRQDGDGFALWDDALFEAFARLPFKPLVGFRFSDVRNYVLRSKKPN